MMKNENKELHLNYINEARRENVIVTKLLIGHTKITPGHVTMGVRARRYSL